MKTHLSTSYFEFLQHVKNYHNKKTPDKDEILRSFYPLSQLPNLQPTALYMLDYVQGKYSFIIPANGSILGYPVSCFLDGGPAFIFSIQHKDDLIIMNEKTFPANLNYIKLHGRKITEVTFTVTYRLKNREGNYRWVAQRSCYTNCAKDGTPLATIGLVSDITAYKTDSRIIHIIEDATLTDNMGKVTTNYYCPDGNLLSKRETEVLKWVCEGLLSKQIADKLNISVHTINNHRKNMLEKTNCKNLSELLNLAVRNGVL